MIFSLRTFAILFLLSLFTISLYAQTEFFVSEGSNGNGTFNSPFGTLDEALAIAQNNDIITLRTGTYDPPSGLIEKSHLTIQGYQGEKPHIKANYIDNSYTSGQDAINVIHVHYDAEYLTLKNLEISGGKCYVVKLDNDFGYPGASNKSAKGAIIEDCELHHSGTDIVKITPLTDNITIKNCEIHHSGLAYSNGAGSSPCVDPEENPNAQGIDNVNADNMLVTQCYIHDIPYDNPALFFKGGSRNCIVERNLFENAYSGIWIGAQTDEDFFTPDDNPEYYNNFNGIVRNNIIKNMRGEGIGFFSANNPKVYNNTLIDCGTKQEEENSTPAIRFAIQSFHNGTKYISPPTINAIFVNNIATRKDPTITEYHDFFIVLSHQENLLPVSTGGLKMKNNRYWDDLYGDLKVRNTNFNLPVEQWDSSTLIEWQNSNLHNSNYAEVQTIYANPNIDTDGKPLEGSNCIGTGIAIDGLNEDFYGNPRPDGSIDIGAIQTSSTLSSNDLTIKNEASSVFNYPNPFKQKTTFLFTIQKRKFVKIAVYNMLGQEVHALGGKAFETGKHHLNFDASNLASGTYIYKVFLGNKAIAKKMILLK